MSHTLQRGQAIILVAVMLGVVVGMAALAIDGSRAYALRRDMQNAVDGAALAAADTYQRTSNYATAEAAATTAFGVGMRLYSAPACGSYGSPGPATFAVTCTFSDGTTLTDTVPVRGAQGAMFQLSASRTLSLQFARILTNGTSPTITSSASSRVNNLLYSPTIAALNQAGCGGAGGSAITVSGTGTLTIKGDLVSDGAINISSGAASIAGDIYARCQASVSGVTPVCYPSGANPACTYPDVAGIVRTGYHYVDPQYPVPAPIGGGQGAPANNVVLLPGVYSALANLTGGRCYFLAGGVYAFQSGFLNVNALISNELKPPDEPNPANNTQLANPQFWNTAGTGCAGSVQMQAVPCSGNGNCGTGNCGNGNGNGNGNGCASAPPGDWSFVVTSTRTDTYNGIGYPRESAPSRCQTVHVGSNQGVQIIVSNVPGATGYNIYAAPPGNGCNGLFGLAETMPVSSSVLNNNLGACPQFTGNQCSLGFETVVINGQDVGSPFAPNAGAAPGTTGAYPPDRETASLGPGLPNQNPARGNGAIGDRANENNCESTAGAYVTCPAAVTPGAVVLYMPGSCLITSNTSDTYVFSGYQYNWMSVYEPPGDTCPNFLGSNVNSGYVGLIYAPSASVNNIADTTFEVAGTGGIIAGTLSFSGELPAITFSSAYAPVPFAARLVS